MSQILIQRQGPLPITIETQIKASGDAMLHLSGSVWSPTEGRRISIRLLMDDSELGEAAIWSNGNNTHRAVVPQAFPIVLDKEWPDSHTPPTYSFTLVHGTDDTTSDVNDVFQLLLQE